jgi:hypothetical protein
MLRTNRVLFLLACGLTFGLAESATAQGVKIRVELIEVYCDNTEDVTGPDEFYIVGALSDGKATKSVLTKAFDINDRQTKVFADDQRVIFEGQVAEGRPVRGGLIALDEDYARDWAKQKEMAKKIADGVSSAAGSSKDKNAQTAGWIIKAAYEVWNVVAETDKDDKLGETMLEIPAEGPAQEVKQWEFSRDDITGYSSWKYQVKYRIVREK